MNEGWGRKSKQGRNDGSYEQKVAVEAVANQEGGAEPYHRIPGAPPPSPSSLPSPPTLKSNGADSRWGASSQTCRRRGNPSRCRPPCAVRDLPSPPAREDPKSENEETMPYRRDEERSIRVLDSSGVEGDGARYTERRRWWRRENVFRSQKNSLAVRSICLYFSFFSAPGCGWVGEYGGGGGGGGAEASRGATRLSAIASRRPETRCHTTWAQHMATPRKMIRHLKFAFFFICRDI